MKKSFLALALVGLLGFLGVSNHIFLIHPSFLLILAAAWCFSLTNHNIHDLVQAHLTAFRGQFTSNQVATYYIQILEEMRRTYVTIGLFIFLYCSIKSLTFLDQPKILGPMISLSLQSMFYVFIFSEIFTRPLSYIHRKNLMMTADHFTIEPKEKKATTLVITEDDESERLSHKENIVPSEQKDEEEVDLSDKLQDKTHSSRYYFSWIGLLSLGVAVSMHNGSIQLSRLQTLINTQSLEALFGISTLFCLTYLSPLEIIYAYQAATQRVELSQDDNESDTKSDHLHLLTLNNVRNLVMATGIILFLLSYMNVLLNMEDPKGLGKRFGQCFLPLMYSFVFTELFCMRLIESLKQRINSHRAVLAQHLEPSQLSIMTVLTTASFTAMIFLLLLLSFARLDSTQM